MTAAADRLAPATTAGEKLCAAVERMTPFLAAEAVVNDREGRFARASVERLVAEGVLAACAPVETGGSGLTSLRDVTALTARLGEADASAGIAVQMHLSLSWYFARTVRHTPRAQQAELKEAGWLREIGAGRMTVASSVAEPGVNPWQLTTTAVPCAEGWRLNGRKALVSISPAATHFYSRVRAETPDGPMQGSVMIPLAVPGVRVHDDWDGLGLRGSGSGRLTFTDVLLPPGAISMRGPWGVRVPAGQEGRAASSAPMVGLYLGIACAARAAALDAVCRGAADGDGRPAGPQTLLAETEVQLTAAHGALALLLGELDRYVTPAAPRSLPADRGRALLKDCVTAGMVVERAACAVVDHAMKLCGGRSYSAGHLLARLHRDVRAVAFMRPYTPAEGWTDFVADTAVAHHGGPAEGGV